MHYTDELYSTDSVIYKSLSLSLLWALTDISSAAAPAVSLSPASPALSSLSLYVRGGRTSHPRSPS